MATPHVAGAAALVLAAAPDLGVDELREVLLQTAFDTHADGRDDETGHGVLDVDAAVTLAKTGAGSETGAPAVLTLDEVKVRDIGQGRRLVTWQTAEPATTSLIFPNGNERGSQTLVTAHSAVARGRSGRTLTYTIRSTAASGETAEETLEISF